MKKNLFFILAISILASCTTSNAVVSNKLFQKRKYQKGWHVNSVNKLDKVKKAETTEYDSELVAQTETKNKTEKENSEPLKKQITAKKQSESSVLNKKTNSSLVVNDSENAINKITEEKALANAFVSDNEKSETNSRQPEEVEKETTTQQHDYSDLLFILLIILCFVIPPVVVGFIKGWSSRELLISLILFLLGFPAFLIYGPISFLAALAAIIYALLILFDII